MNGIDLSKRDRPENFTKEEWESFKMKLREFKPLNDKEWELFIKLKDEIDKSSMVIGVNFYNKTMHMIKTEDGWKFSHEVYPHEVYHAITPRPARRYYEVYPYEAILTHEEKKKAPTKCIIIFCGLYSILIITLIISLWSLYFMR